MTGPVTVAELSPWLDLSAAELAQLPPGRGGTPVTSLTKHLLRLGHHVTVATLDSAAADGEVNVAGERLRLLIGRYRPAHRARDAFRVERRFIADALAGAQPDVVHAHWTYEYALGAIRTGLPLVVTVHDWAPTILRLHTSPYRAVRLGMNVVALSRARHLTTVSPYLQERLERWTRRTVRVIPNGIDAEDIAPHVPPGPSEPPTVAAVNAGWGARKNVSALIEAFALLHRRLPTYRLRLIGPGYGPGEVAERWASSRGLADGVEFVGRLTPQATRTAIRAADVLMHPSLEESFGMVLLEAMAGGIPVVAGARSGAVPWVLDHGRAGVLVDVTRPPEILAGIERLLADADTWRHYAEAGHRHASRRFPIPVIADQYLDAYRAALTSRIADGHR